MLKCEMKNMEYFSLVLDQFQQATGLKINFDKTRIIPMNENPSWANWSVVSKFKVVIHSTPFKYLGTQLSASDSIHTAENFPFNDKLIEDDLKLHRITTTCISGHILQIKALVASKMVYLFQLLPNPDKEWFTKIEWLMVNHMWDQGCHHISKEKMITPKEKGGFNMLNIRLQNCSLKLKWIDRLLSDRTNLSFSSAYCWLVRGSLFIAWGCPRDSGKGWRGDLGTFMISRPT